MQYPARPRAGPQGRGDRRTSWPSPAARPARGRVTATSDETAVTFDDRRGFLS
ncbi:hypothetical protein [Streptomyces thioluteus]|uniref:hypothetical protein n=1 Tax=Streptomyces thioluteus TaxID=66431 RepID=UPI0031F08A3E